MFRIHCKCKKSNKNFHNNIGDFYVDDCCKAAGYDDLGRPIAGTPAAEVKPSVAEVVTNKIAGIINSAMPNSGSAVAQQSGTANPSPAQTTTSQPDAPQESKLERVLAFFKAGNPLSRSKLKSLKMDELLQVAKEHSIVVPDSLTRDEVLEHILKSK